MRRAGSESVTTLTYLNFDVQIERAGDGYTPDVSGPASAGTAPAPYRVLVESPNAGTVRAAFDPPFSDLELENFLLRAGPSRRGVRRLDSQEMDAAKQFGRR